MSFTLNSSNTLKLEQDSTSVLFIIHGDLVPVSVHWIKKSAVALTYSYCNETKAVQTQILL